MRITSTHRSTPASRRGMTLLEVAIAAVIVATIMVVSNAAFLSSFNATEQAQDQRGVARLLDTTLENLRAQPYGTLLALNGNIVYDGEGPSDSRAAVRIETFLADVNLVQIRAIATDVATGQEIGRVVAQRSAR